MSICKLCDSDSDLYEKFLYSTFLCIKEILGVNCKTSNDVIRAELARFTLRTKIIMSSIKY